jgi:hypothetical protein
MILWGVAMVRNEADVVEAFVRHNLAFLDGLVVLDHRSADGTFETLAALESEGLRLVHRRTFEEGFFKSRHVSALARECFAQHGADFVFALDADEFIHAASREAIEDALAAVPPASHALHLWRSYVPTTFARPFGPHCLQMRLREETTPRAKVIIRRTLADREGVSEGNHWVVAVGTRLRAAHHVIAPDVMCLAHCPVRNASQLERKATLGYQARLVATGGRISPALSSHWREIGEDLDRGDALTEARLRTIAANYTVPRSQWIAPENIELVDDPVELRGVARMRMAAE